MNAGYTSDNCKSELTDHRIPKRNQQARVIVCCREVPTVLWDDDADMVAVRQQIMAVCFVFGVSQSEHRRDGVVTDARNGVIVAARGVGHEILIC